MKFHLLVVPVAAVLALSATSARAELCPFGNVDPFVATGSNGDLLIAGDEAANAITVAQITNGVRVTIDGVTYGDFVTANYTGITIRGCLGNDNINASGVSTDVYNLDTRPNFGTTILGDEGNDTLRGTSANDVMYGGPGDDNVSGNQGDDILDGEDGNDTVNGNDGDDVVEGGTGDLDKLFGNCGNDKVADKDGVDRAQGGDGEDKLILIFRDGWKLSGQLRSDNRISGGYELDYVEIYNQSAAAMYLNVHGDIPKGYPQPATETDPLGDTIYFFGNLAAGSLFPGFETVYDF